MNFQLSRDGEQIALFDPNGLLVDHVTFGVQTSDVSEGRFPDGAASPYSMLMPTPRTPNVLGGGNSPVITPIFVITGAGGQQVSFSFPTVPGKTYRVQRTDSLVEPVDWQTFGTDTVAAGNSLNVIDNILPGTQRFYRIVVLN